MARPQRKIIISDATLRDGEQSPGAGMDVREKVLAAKQLEMPGVDKIEWISRSLPRGIPMRSSPWPARSARPWSSACAGRAPKTSMEFLKRMKSKDHPTL